ncbi:MULTISPECIES: universal stress protein [Gammaproteobacteria]|uniref:universal stress protein n=1 Tax=Gammaproteobacteria TaxID=1236 RepID=UPI001ADB9AAF|nr:MULTISPECIES: universal stress protein [Gammaproteobacteria]MBO9484534.1 universal stress protein [Salinisphaera sp. G21_0]MBO9497123.1 universal stress protein [Thalassotalea sp. G20_0]
MHAFRSILLAVTRQHTSDMELQQAFRLALDNRATLLIALFDQSLETLNHLQFVPLEKKLEDHLRQQLEDELERLKAMAWEQGIEAETLIVPGRPRQAIYKVIKEHHIDLVIKLADASGALTRKQLTGNDLALLRKCPVPILMMADRDQLPQFNGKILVAVDAGDPDSDAHDLNRTLLQYGLYLASQEKAALHLVSVWNVPLGRRSLKTLSDEELYELQEITQRRYHNKLQEVMQEVGVTENDDQQVSIHLLRGNPATEIQQLANELNVDVIVMGTLGRHKEGILVGNTAENIMNSIYCSILAVKPEGFISPLAKAASG